MIKNSAGKIFYGMHFYPGVAEYREEGRDPTRIFINENTIRRMSPSFAGRPIFVEHVEEVEQNIDELRKEADGYVIESFFNSADGKTWVKFIVTSQRGLDAIAKGFRLSNAYVPKSYGAGGQWNGVDYEKEVTEGEFEHLAIVQNPRYEESVVKTPEEFKLYNANAESELRRLANSKDPKKESTKMAFGIFKRTKVENSKDLEGSVIELPKSKKEVTLEKLVNDADEMAMNEGKEQMCNGEHMVDVDGKKMSLNDLLAEHKKNSEELSKMKANAGGEGSEESMENDEEDEAAKKKALEIAEHEESEIVEEDDKKENDEDEEAKKAEEKKKNDKKAEGKKHFDALKNAANNGNESAPVLDLTRDQVARGRARYGS